MKTSRLIILLFAILAVMITAVFQFFKLNTVEIGTLTRTTEQVLEIKQQDIKLNEEALKAASFKLVHFDGIVNNINNLNDTRKSLRPKIKEISTYAGPALTDLMRSLEKSLDARIQKIERLKAKVALARNSSSFLLTAIRKHAATYGLTSSVLALRALNELQGFQIFPTPERLENAQSILKLLKTQTIQQGAENNLSNVIRHMEVSFQATQEISGILKDLFASDSQTIVDQMISNLHILQNQRQNSSNQTSFLLMGAVLITFLALAFALIRWNQAREKSHQASELFKEAVESMSEGFAFFDHDRKLAFWNTPFEDLHQTMKEKLVKGMTFEEFEKAQSDTNFLLQREEQIDGGTIDLTADGRWLLSSNTAMAQGGHCLTRVDLTAQRKTQEQLHLAATVFQSASEAMMVTDKKGNIRMVNPAFTRITGYSEAEAIGQTPALLSSGRHDKAYYHKMYRALERNGIWQGEIWNRRKNGEIYPEWLSITTIYDDRDDVMQRVSLFTDITSRKKSEERIHYQANYDTLTDLPNRNLFKDRLDQAISLADRHKQRIAVLFLDIDNFKHINDTLGHLMGDELLRNVADRLRSLFRTSDTIARLSGDEFVLILNNANRDSYLEQLLNRILECLSLPYLLEGNTTYTSVSIGATFYPDDAKSTDALLQNADAAMFKAKEMGRDTYCFFTPEMNSRAQERHDLEVAMHHALEKEHFVLHYQPIVDPLTKKVVSTESLVRWADPEKGLIPPGKFIPVAEDTGLIVPMGEWILRKACTDCAQWNKENNLPIGVSVNLSSRQFQRSDIFALVKESLETTGLMPEKLTLEITESLLVDDDSEVLKTLRNIRNLGVKLSIDDFGTGYSSLSYLKHFPITTLKIDRSFINEVLSDPEDAALTQAILSMAQSLNLKVIAEGVEDAGQVEYLVDRNCDLIQGFHYSKPLPLNELTDAFASKKLVF